MKTFLATTFFCFLLPSGLLAAPGPLVRDFASCAGRLSATMEFQWLLSDPAADQTKAARAAMLALLSAVMDPQDASAALATRIEAKHAHSVLLTRAHFNQDPQDSDWAAARAEVEIGRCRALILS